MAQKYDEPLTGRLYSPGHFIAVFLLLSLFMSPLWVYFRKVPKLITIDGINRNFHLQRKRKSSVYDLTLDQISFASMYKPLYAVLEIYGTFQSSRGHTLEKRIATIIVPNKGMSWNAKVLKEIDTELSDLNVPRQPFKPRKFWSYLYD
jgi:hypothetical protein